MLPSTLGFSLRSVCLRFCLVHFNLLHLITRNDNMQLIHRYTTMYVSGKFGTKKMTRSDGTQFGRYTMWTVHGIDGTQCGRYAV